MKKDIPLFQALLPVFFLITALSFNVVGVYGDNALGGSNQVILLCSGFVALLVGRLNKVQWSGSSWCFLDINVFTQKSDQSS
jgi:NhaC family Na+:H+ antiporter